MYDTVSEIVNHSDCTHYLHDFRDRQLHRGDLRARILANIEAKMGRKMLAITVAIHRLGIRNRDIIKARFRAQARVKPIVMHTNQLGNM